MSKLGYIGTFFLFALAVLSLVIVVHLNVLDVVPNAEVENKPDEEDRGGEATKVALQPLRVVDEAVLALTALFAPDLGDHP